MRSAHQLTSYLFTMNQKGAKRRAVKRNWKMSEDCFPGVSPGIVKEVSLFDLDSKDSGFSEDATEESKKVEIEIPTPPSLEDTEATVLRFSPQDSPITPKNGKHFLGRKKRLFVSNCQSPSPSCSATKSLKRLKLFDLECEETFDHLALDFSDRILQEESSDNEVSCSVLSSSPKASSSKYSDKLLDQCLGLKDKSSENSNEIQKTLVKAAVEKSSSEELIGDFSKGYALPLIAGSHPDLKCISVHTMKDVLDGIYKGVLNSVMIIDSRYPYEFEGGHIRGAKNIYTMTDCSELLNRPVNYSEERHIIIFHCEFSKERGPNMARRLRKEDRTRNATVYPALTYPEVYVLEGGYKRFFETYPRLCEPMKYMQMLHPEHADEMRFFRKKSKTSENVMQTTKKNGCVSRTSRVIRKSLSNSFF